MIIDAHTHILSLAQDPEFTVEYGREGSLCIYRSMGLLPSHRLPTEEEWEASGFTRAGWPVIGPDESVRDHPGFDKIVVLAVSPQCLDGQLIGTVDTAGMLGVEGPPTPEKCNDYIAAVVSAEPGRFIGFASVNPAYRGPGGRGRGTGASRHRARPVRAQALPDVPALGRQRPACSRSRSTQGAGAGHPGDGPPGRLDPDRRQLELAPPGAAGRRRAELPRSAGDHRPLRDALGGRGDVPADQAPELLRRAVATSSPRHPARPVPAAARASRCSCRWRSCSSAPTTPASSTTRSSSSDKLLGVNEEAECCALPPIPAAQARRHHGRQLRPRC